MIERIGMDHDEGKSLAGNFVVNFKTVGGAVHLREIVTFKCSSRSISALRSNRQNVFCFSSSDGLNELNVLNGLNDCLLRVPRPLLFDLFFYFVELHDVAVLVMHI